MAWSGERPCPMITPHHPNKHTVSISLRKWPRTRRCTTGYRGTHPGFAELCHDVFVVSLLKRVKDLGTVWLSKGIRVREHASVETRDPLSFLRNSRPELFGDDVFGKACAIPESGLGNEKRWSRVKSNSLWSLRECG